MLSFSPRITPESDGTTSSSIETAPVPPSRSSSWQAFFFLSSHHEDANIRAGADVRGGHEHEDDEAPPDSPMPMARRVFSLFSSRPTLKNDATNSGSIETAPVPPFRSPTWPAFFSFSRRRMEANVREGSDVPGRHDGEDGDEQGVTSPRSPRQAEEALSATTAKNTALFAGYPVKVTFRPLRPTVVDSPE